MYEAFFGFSQRPFRGAPRLEDYFPSASMEEARQTVQQCLERGAGWAVVIGPPGVGKTLLCQRLAQELEKSFPVLLVSAGGLSSRRELWQTFLYGLGQPYRGMEEGELRLALVEYLREQRNRSPAFILLVDEAHLLAGRLLEEIRIVSQLPGLPGDWFRVLLAGTPVLEERLSHPRLEAVNQRIVGRCYLEPWTRGETQAYIRRQLQKAGSASDRLFLEEAAEAVFQATNGIPRLVNQLCDHALWWACKHGERQVDMGIVQQAWADLQQLPPPSVGAVSSGPVPGLIEFGVLQEDEGFSHQEASTKSQLPPATPDSSAYASQATEEESFGRAGAGPTALGSHWSGEESLPVEDSSGAESRAGHSGGLGGVQGDVSAEEADGAGPEHELFFGAWEQSDSEVAEVGGLQEDSLSQEIDPQYHLSAWDRFQEIEQAISQMGGESGEDLCGDGKAACGQENLLPSQGADGSAEQPAASIRQDVSIASNIQQASQAQAWPQPSDRPEGTEACCMSGYGPVGKAAASAMASIHAGEGASQKSQPAAPGENPNLPPPSRPVTSSVVGPPLRLVQSSSQAPEVELVFGLPVASMARRETLPMEANPFAETFLEEEWIEDPYLQLGMEGHRPWSVLGPFPKEPSPSEKTASNSAPAPCTSADNPSNEPRWQPSDSSPVQRGSIEAPDDSGRVCEVGLEASGGWKHPPQTVAIQEPPLIVIEEELVEEPAHEQKTIVVPISRHEYRRLFARLRRG